MGKLATLVVLASLIGAVSCQSWTSSIYISWGYPNWGSPRPRPPRTPISKTGLQVGYYAAHNCSKAEAIVRSFVEKADAGLQAGLIRLFFHDCFVRGCDASVLLNQTVGGPETEKQGFPNLSLRGYNVVDAAKADLEDKCPGVVSCADILAFAARDASYILSNKKIDYLVPAGRRDGMVSLASETLGQNLPPPFANITTLTEMFDDKGLSQTEMLVLSGGHSIGRSFCGSFSDRINPPNPPAPSMHPELAKDLNEKCGTSDRATTTVSQDSVTAYQLDNQYYKNVLNGKVLFTSDEALNSPETLQRVKKYAGEFPYISGESEWNTAFGEAMVKMGYIGVKTSPEGEIRNTCWRVNNY